MRKLFLLSVNVVAVVLVVGIGLQGRTFAAASAETPLISSWETSTGGSEGRDCGYSTVLGKSDLWLFCDTALYNSGDQLVGFIPGSTAATAGYAAGKAPGRLTDLPSGTDEQFIATPSGLRTPSGAACTPANGAYAASWASGLTTIPGTTSALITYNNYCVTTAAMTLEGYGVAVYKSGEALPIAGHTVVASVPPAAPISPAFTLGSPIYSGSYIYFYASQCTSSIWGVCTAGDVWLARVASGSYATASAYRWLGANGVWQTSPSKAVSVITGSTPLATSATVTSHGVTLVTQTDISGGYAIWTASSFGGKFSEVASGTVACTVISPDLCRALNPHAELSNASELTVSYFDPSEGPHGHVVTTQLGW